MIIPTLEHRGAPVMLSIYSGCNSVPWLALKWLGGGSSVNANRCSIHKVLATRRNSHRTAFVGVRRRSPPFGAHRGPGWWRLKAQLAKHALEAHVRDRVAAARSSPAMCIRWRSYPENAEVTARAC
uniref:Uncharacterized protein n=1 Tax=Arundo donax TaxID=35708 RepID=A0A0A9GEM6_ARUDO